MMCFRKNFWIYCLALWSLLLHSGEVVFIATADLHGNLRALAKLAPVIRRYPDAVKLDLGDFSQSNFAVTEQNGIPVVDAFNSLGYEVLVPGNHDLEYPEEVLHLWRRRFKGAVLGAQWRLGKFIPLPWVIVERNGFRIGVIGLGDAGMKKRNGFWHDFQSADEIASVRQAVNYLRHERCDGILLACHISSTNYRILGDILHEVPEIDVAIGAHSHKENAGSFLRGKYVLQPGSHGESALYLSFCFDENRRLKYIRSKLLRPAEEMDKAVLTLAEDAERSSANSGDIPLRYFSDAASFGKAAAESICKAVDCDAAIFAFNPGKFRKGLTVEKLYDMLPYGNRIAVVSVDRETALKILKLRRKRLGEFFAAGDFNRDKIRLALSDYLFFALPELSGKEGSITGIFERDVLIEAWKKQEY